MGDHDENATSVQCPLCDAKAGDECTRVTTAPKGERIDFFHGMRVWRYQKSKGESHEQ